MWMTIAYATQANKDWMGLVPVEADKRLKDPEKIKADLTAKVAKQVEESAADPLRARFAGGLVFFSDNSKTVAIQHASELFGDLKRCTHILVPDPSLFMRIGLLEVCEGAPSAGAALAAEEVRFGLSEGRCLDPGRLLFGRSVSMKLLAQRLKMDGLPGFSPDATVAQRLHDELDVLVRIGKQVWE